MRAEKACTIYAKFQYISPGIACVHVLQYFCFRLECAAAGYKEEKKSINMQKLYTIRRYMLVQEVHQR